MSDLTGGLENIYIYFYFATVCKELNVSPHPYKVPPIFYPLPFPQTGEISPLGIFFGGCYY